MTSNDPIIRSLASLATALQHRFNLGLHTTEDAVRYTFFASILSELKCGPERLILEYPHPKRERALVDAWISSWNDEPEIALEFKFHRRPPDAKNRPRTMLAGSILSDLSKLADFDDSKVVRRIFVYVYGAEMQQYYNNKNNGMTDLFVQGSTDVLVTDQILEGKSETFLNNAGPIVPCRLSPLVREQISEHFRLLAYEVFPLNLGKHSRPLEAPKWRE